MASTEIYSEQDLIIALKAGDDQAFSYLYDHYSGSLYSTILQIVKSPGVAGDVLQEVFINIWRKIESYDPSRGRLFTWMLNMGRNTSIDMLRSKGGNDHVTQTNIDNIGLTKFLGKLRSEHRILIELAYLKGYTHEEIAQIEDIPLGTVKTHIRNALLQLRAYLK